jgi:integrase
MAQSLDRGGVAAVSSIENVGTKSAPRYRARWRTPDGESRSKTFTRKADAERHLTKMENDKLTGVYVDPRAGKVTFRAFAEQWRQMQVHRSGTAKSVEQQLRLHVYPHIGHRPIGAIRTGEVQAMVRRLVAASSAGGAEMAASTVEVIYGRVAAVFRAAVRDRVIALSPCVDVTVPAPPPSSMLQVLTSQQVVAIADEVPEYYRALVIAGAGLGLRPGELFGLALDRVDFLRRSVRVDQQLARLAGGGVGLEPPKTAASYRTVPLPQTVAGALAAHLARWSPHPTLGVIFTTSKGSAVQERVWRQVWATARERAGAPEWATPHDLRHHYASLLIRSGASVKVVQSRLGHASAKTTLDIYGHLFPDEEDRTRAAIDDAFSGVDADSVSDLCHEGTETARLPR